jgi:hypothetical protein
MFHTIVRIAAIASLVCFAQAGVGALGNTSYRAEVEPLVKARPELAGLLKGLKIADTGDGNRISYFQSPALAGKHVGPYSFTATDAGGRKFTVQLRTRERFVNAHGLVVAELYDGQLLSGGSYQSAVKVDEELVEVSVL